MHTMPRAWGKLNTDFPNYYLSARIAHEGSDPARLYEWVWLQREKDHRALDDRLIGLIPITPFSTLFMWPLTGLAPLTAKHAWLLVNLALLAAPLPDWIVLSANCAGLRVEFSASPQSALWPVLFASAAAHRSRLLGV